MSLAQQRRVDPVHFFNEVGESYLTIEYLLEQIEELREQVERLQRTNSALVQKVKFLGGE